MGNKAKKARKRRDARVKAWEDISQATHTSPTTKVVMGNAYKKPGSLNLRK